MTRTLHCGKSITNYDLCIDFSVAGFTKRGPQKNDLIYLCIKTENKTVCGCRFVLDEVTDNKPWADSERYVLAYSIKDIEFCTPFELTFLYDIGGKYWNLKYLQASKAFDSIAENEIEKQFKINETPHRYKFEKQNEEDEELDFEDTIKEDDVEEVLKSVPEIELQIMGTFQTVNFLNESDKLRGLESLVNKNFFDLFTQYNNDKTILIPENRLFLTNGPKKDGYFVQGIRTIPDALLITFDKKQKYPIQISLVEYECYGEGKVRPNDKSNYLNSQIIPQLMRFASAFSIITDQNTRNENTRDWIKKIVDYTGSNQILESKIDSWIKEMQPEIRTREIISYFEKKLEEAFKSNIHVYLIIDELSIDQRETIKNVIRSFKLENGDPIVFDSSIVKLVQKISLMNQDYEYGLTVQ